MVIYISLILGHCLADYPFQGDFLARMKGENTFLLAIHSLIWSCTIWLILNYFDRASAFDFWQLFIGHALIDKWKCSRPDKNKALTDDLYVDQLLHGLQILFALAVFK